MTNMPEFMMLFLRRRWRIEPRCVKLSGRKLLAWQPGSVDMKMSKIVEAFQSITRTSSSLSDIDPADTCDIDFDKDEAKAMLADSTQRLATMQEFL